MVGADSITVTHKHLLSRLQTAPPPPGPDSVLHLTGSTALTRGRILGHNWDKSLKSFPPCYSQSPLLIVPNICDFPDPLSSSYKNIYSYLYRKNCCLSTFMNLLQGQK
jgi:hypothetical protein